MNQAAVTAAPGTTSPPAVGLADGGGSLKGPGYPAQDREVTCPSCGRFAGTYERCPYCGARLEVRLSIRVLRRLSLVVGILGVAILFAAAPHLEVPLREVSSFTPTSNFAILRIRGRVIADPLYGDRGGSFYMGVDDGTGRINLKAYGKAVEPLKALGLAAGDVVEAQGSIRVEAGKAPSMFLAVARHVKLVEKGTGAAPQARPRTEIPKVRVLELTPERAARKELVQVEGLIRRAWTTDVGSGGDLHDGSGKLVVWLYENERAALGPAFDHLAAGSRLRVTGRLASYRTKGGELVLQIRPLTREGSIELLGTEPVGGSRPPRRSAPPPSPVPPEPAGPGADPSPAPDPSPTASGPSPVTSSGISLPPGEVDRSADPAPATSGIPEAGS